MKRLVCIFALVVLAAVQANAQTVVLDADTSQGDNVATIVGETYTVTPVSGAWNDDNNVSGCDGGGANCTEGFEFSYTVDASPFALGGDTALVTDKFSTEAAAFASAQGTTFIALDTIAEVFLPCGGCFGAVGIITLEFVLQQILGIVMPPTFTFTAEDFKDLSLDPAPSIEKVLLDYGDTQTANLSNLELAKLVATVMGEYGTLRELVYDDLRYTSVGRAVLDKEEEFKKTKEGAKLWSDREFIGGAVVYTTAYHNARNEYASDEIKLALVEHDKNLAKIISLADAFEQRKATAESQRREEMAEEDFGNWDNKEFYMDITLPDGSPMTVKDGSPMTVKDGSPMTVKDALNSDDAPGMDELFESVMPELTGIVVQS